MITARGGRGRSGAAGDGGGRPCSTGGRSPQVRLAGHRLGRPLPILVVVLILPAPLRDTVDRQHDAVSREQILAAGLTEGAIRAQVAAHRWSRVHPGTYVVHRGPLPRPTRLWCALLACGPGSVLSHRTAAEEDGLYDELTMPLRITVPADRRVAVRGVEVHYSIHLAERRHPHAVPPRPRVEETVLDLVDRSLTDREVVDLVTRACQRRRTTPARLAAAAAARKKLRRRQLFEALLLDARDGAESPLEQRYLHGVERAHGLPAGERQTRSRHGARWRDVLYRQQAVLVELDGQAAHPQELAFRDLARDNAHLVQEGQVTLHYGWHAVSGEPCGVAAQVATVLRGRGWQGRPRRCGAGCLVA